METILANLSAGKVRREKMWGREFFVAPMTMIVPGVLAGSQGPGYYPEDVVTVNHRAWNYMPIVVPEHPKVDGKFVSARSPEIIDKYGVGFVFNSTGDGKLAAEAWFDVELTRERSLATHDRLAANKSIELSTGLEPTVIKQSGEFNGVKYDWTVTNIGPDHLAVLPEGEGACSRKHGCGVLVNEDRSLLQKLIDLISNNKQEKETTTVAKLNDADRAKLVENLVANCGCQQEKLFTNEDRDYLSKLPDDRLQSLATGLERRAKQEKFLANLSKGVDQGGNVIIVNSEKESVELKPKAPVVHEIAGKKYALNEKTGNLEPLSADGAAPVVNTQAEKPKAKTKEEYLAEMPPDLRAGLESVLTVNQQQKNQYISAILGNAANEYKPEELAKMEIPELKKLAALAGNSRTGYEGFESAPGPLFFGAGAPQLTLNQGDDQGDILELPTMDFTTSEK